jgi:hypothetical protein
MSLILIGPMNAIRNRERRCSNYVAGIWRLIARNETFTDGSVYGAVGRTGLVRKAGKVLLDEACLEILSRIYSHDFLAQLRRKLTFLTDSRSLREQAPRQKCSNF